MNEKKGEKENVNKLHKQPEGKKHEQNRGEKTLVAGKKLDLASSFLFLPVHLS